MAFVLYGYAVRLICQWNKHNPPQEAHACMPQENPRTRLVRIVAAAQNIPLELVEVVPRENIGRQLLLDRFPRSHGKIPALDAPGLQLTETISIALVRRASCLETPQRRERLETGALTIPQYLARIRGPTCLLGDGSPEQEAEIVSWMSWANQELLGTLARWFLPLIPNLSRRAPYSKPDVEAGKADSLAMLNTLETLLGSKHKTRLVGEEVTLADIFVAIVLARGLERVLGAAWRTAHPHCMRHFDMVRGWEPVRGVVPEFALVDVETPNVNPYDGRE
ncbi:hypothetical protein E4U53_005414 [Claviceps sorghi]|nr:hypothetical protein E4U53_005414 [Claviceps sorghi]